MKGGAPEPDQMENSYPSKPVAVTMNHKKHEDLSPTIETPNYVKSDLYETKKTYTMLQVYFNYSISKLLKQ